MSNDKLPPTADVEQLNSRLNDGLKSCRSVISNYRALLEQDGGAVAAGAESAAEEQPGPEPGDTA